MNNLKNVLKIYALERDLNPDDLALLNTLRGLSDTERAMTVEAFGGSMGKPGKGVSSAKPKKLQKCDVCGVSKRAAHHRDTSHKDYHEFDGAAQGSRFAHPGWPQQSVVAFSEHGGQRPRRSSATTPLTARSVTARRATGFTINRWGMRPITSFSRRCGQWGREGKD